MYRFVVSLVLFLSSCRGASAPEAIDQRAQPPELFRPSSGPPAQRTMATRLASKRSIWGPWSRRQVTLSVRDVELVDVLTELATSWGIDLVLPSHIGEGLELTVDVQAITARELLAHFEAMFPVRFVPGRDHLHVESVDEPTLELLMYPLVGGLVPDAQGGDFRSLRELSFISKDGVEEAPDNGDITSQAVRLEAFMKNAEELLPWPEGSSWYLDRRQGLLFVRSVGQTLDHLVVLLDALTAPPALVAIETRFLELSEGHGYELGFESELTDVFPLDRDGLKRTQSGLGTQTGVQLGVPQLLPGEASGLTVELLGILTQPRFEMLLKALSSRQSGEVLSAPSVSVVNNSKATVAITRNLPFVEDYRPVVDDRIVSGDGITQTESDVALVASINDENFTGIVLNVTPSVGRDPNQIHLHLEPVVRDQVDAVVISNGAVVEGVPTPAISRPIIETRIIDTQIVIPDGATVVMGGLKRTAVSKTGKSVPWLGSIPWLGRLFRYETDVHERRDLYILVTARILNPVR